MGPHARGAVHRRGCGGLGNSASSNWLAGRSAGAPLVSNVCCVNEEVGSTSSSATL